MDSLEPGDAVLADRGFLIDDDLKARCITLIFPAFLGPNRAQLSAEEVHDTRRIAEARIHIERAIGKIKLFKILNGDFPLSMKPIVGRLFATCAFLTNFQSPNIQVPAEDTACEE